MKGGSLDQPVCEKKEFMSIGFLQVDPGVLRDERRPDGY
jgi:hypothetical protein